jgi:hypothetical protein
MHPGKLDIDRAGEGEKRRSCRVAVEGVLWYIDYRLSKRVTTGHDKIQDRFSLNRALLCDSETWVASYRGRRG